LKDRMEDILRHRGGHASPSAPSSIQAHG
jgi:hypothetical protein